MGRTKLKDLLGVFGAAKIGQFWLWDTHNWQMDTIPWGPPKLGNFDLGTNKIDKFGLLECLGRPKLIKFSLGKDKIDQSQPYKVAKLKHGTMAK